MIAQYICEILINREGYGVSKDPFTIFDDWFALAVEKEPNDPNAMALATADARGYPSARMVLLKGHDREGFVFYTNLGSRKARELAENPRAAILFHWKSLKRQIRIAGEVESVSAAEADAYFSTRPKASQIGAWASIQSQPLESRFALEQRIATFTAKYGVGETPRPAFWSGFRLRPDSFEFWEDRPFRLHDRIVHERDGSSWSARRLYP